jgi:hypothetical protein
VELSLKEWAFFQWMVCWWLLVHSEPLYTWITQGLLLLFLHLCEGFLRLLQNGITTGSWWRFFTFQKNEKLCNFRGLFTALSFLSKESKSALSDWKGSNSNNRLKNSLLYIAFFCLFCGVCYLWWPTRVSYPQKIGFHGLDFLMNTFNNFFGQLFLLRH